MRKALFTTVVPLIWALANVPASADVVYSQSWDGTTGLFASQNDTSPGGFGSFAKVYENFSLGSSASITDVHWTGGYYNPASKGTISSFLIEFWSDSTTGPGSLLASATISGSANETSLATFPSALIYTYEVDLPSAFEAQAGTTYWLSIQPATAFPPQWGWATSSQGDGSSYQYFNGSTQHTGANFAFDLTSTPREVPEPGSLLLAALALFAATGRLKKRRP